MTKKTVEGIIAEFDKLFTSSFAGDSGIGGNTPQDPVYEWATGNPQEVRDFLRTEITALLELNRKEAVELIKRWHIKRGGYTELAHQVDALIKSRITS